MLDDGDRLISGQSRMYFVEVLKVHHRFVVKLFFGEVGVWLLMKKLWSFYCDFDFVLRSMVQDLEYLLHASTIPDFNFGGRA